MCCQWGYCRCMHCLIVQGSCLLFCQCEDGSRVLHGSNVELGEADNVKLVQVILPP